MVVKGGWHSEDNNRFWSWSLSLIGIDYYGLEMDLDRILTKNCIVCFALNGEYTFTLILFLLKALIYYR